MLQLCSRLINRRCFFLQDGSYGGHALGRFSPLVLLNGFTDCGHGLDRISGICAGRINLVLEPGPSGKSFIAQEKAFTLVEFFIESGQSRGGNTAVILSKFLQGCVIALRCLLQCLNTILKRSKIDSWRHIHPGGRLHRFLWIGNRGKHTFVQLRVALACLVLLGLEQLFQFFHISLEGVGLAAEIKGSKSASASRMIAVPAVCASARP